MVHGGKNQHFRAGLGVFLAQFLKIKIKADHSAGCADICLDDRCLLAIVDITLGQFSCDQVVLIIDTINPTLPVNELGRVAHAAVRHAAGCGIGNIAVVLPGDLLKMVANLISSGSIIFLALGHGEIRRPVAGFRQDDQVGLVTQDMA